MDNFETIQPSPQLAPYVKHYWFLTGNIINKSVPIQRIVPTGHVTMVFHRNKALISANSVQPDAFLSGQSNNFTDLYQTDSLNMMVVVFHPQGARAFFKMPMIEVKNRNVSLQDLGDNEVAELEKRIKDSQDNHTCIRLIENLLLQKIKYGTEYNEKRIASVIETLNRGEMNVEKLAAVSCLSNKQFRRIFSEYIGTNPKDYVRVVRFQRALYTLQTSPDIALTQLAFDCGYYDQPHLIREFREFSGYTPTEYKAACAFIISDYFSL